MNIDDPKLTAYALDELDEAERVAITHEVAASPEAQCGIEQVSSTSGEPERHSRRSLVLVDCAPPRHCGRVGSFCGDWTGDFRQLQIHKLQSRREADCIAGTKCVNRRG